MPKPMTPIDIKHALEKAGYTQVEIAEECEVSVPTVNQTIKGTTTSHRIRLCIAKKIGKPVEEVFNVSPNPSKPGPKRK